MNAGKSDRAVARRKWDLSTIFGVPKSCLHLQYPRNLGRGRSHGPHKFYIPVVPRRHSFDERIFAAPSAKGNSGESLLTRESIGKEAELEMKLAIVSNALMKEGEERHRMDNELRRLQKENKRLQEDLRTASHQLRKFSEWFFTSVEPSNT